ncbi:porphobilinogen synthase [Methanolapillus millepedarum]|uniref:Delta-aminolevulinic acid dehydratase n=1 Tax=Methanolapillus millepedarum TaxID=3028296 RepID=A0AA96VBX7_9EURY|nr:Delta-aminolevulinic acid dehydratase [Methanosarcinaceae archaeon Ac7]
MPFPVNRMRRLRSGNLIKEMVRENTLSVSDLIYPFFVDENATKKVPVSSMPGVFRWPLNLSVDAAREAFELKIPAVLIFGIPKSKDAKGTHSYGESDVVQEAVRRIKAEFGDKLLVVTDLCMCEYTDHGHCGIVDMKTHEILNDETLPVLGKIAVSHAKAGADIIAPSGMMDGMIAAIRSALDENGFSNTPIMSYSSKYASVFYGPFRDAADSGFCFGDRASYQMDPANSDEAVRETQLDVEEGADILMVKPGMPYLDIVFRIKQEFKMPLAIYQVSGEYSMIKAAAKNGWLDEEKCFHESMISMKRAGADMIITYYAKEMAAILSRK